jgi:hypothetical protein
MRPCPSMACVQWGAVHDDGNGGGGGGGGDSDVGGELKLRPGRPDACAKERDASSAPEATRLTTAAGARAQVPNSSLVSLDWLKTPVQAHFGVLDHLSGFSDVSASRFSTLKKAFWVGRDGRMGGGDRMSTHPTAHFSGPEHTGLLPVAAEPRGCLNG